MSDNENQPPNPSKQTSSVPLGKQTSSVPLKKETVRVTLKASDAPPAVPSATVPMAPPVRPPVPTAPPTPTAGGGARPPAPAPTIPLRTAGAPGAGAPTMGPAPTIRLATGGAPTSRVGGAAGGPPTIALPKATVQLQAPTQPLGTSFSKPSLTASQTEDEEEEEGNGGLLNILSIVGFAAALVVLVFQLMTANTWISAPDSEGPGDWSKLMN